MKSINSKQPRYTKQYQEGMSYIDRVLPQLIDPQTNKLKRQPTNTELSTALRKAGYRWNGYTYEDYR